MDSTKKRSDEYWMGVRDSLRMVDSFIKWARRNEERAKTLDDFIHDGLVAAAKRCESCLKDDLGLSFAEDAKESEDLLEPEHVPPGYESSSAIDTPPEEVIEMTPDDMSPETTEVLIESEDDSMSIDTVGRLEREEMDDLSLEGPPREFSSDFELMEPTDLDVDASESDEEADSTSESDIEEESVEDEDQKPSFTWADYEKAITPPRDASEITEEDEDVEVTEEDEDVELPPPMKLEPDEEESDSIVIPEPPEPPIDDSERSFTDEEESDSTESTESITRPPPPPPPESDEDEEERRRRARRLFFGD